MDDIIILALSLFSCWLLLKKLPEILLRKLFPTRHDKYIHHVCDRRKDKECVDCQLNIARAFLIR